MSSKTDPAITYHNPFQNTIFSSRSPSDMSSQTNNSSLYPERFTATGRPIRSSMSASESGLSGLAGFESLGASAPNLLPVRFTDNSIISVPVLPHAEPSQAKGNDSDVDSELVKETKSSSRFSLSSFRRKSSSGNTRKAKQDFVIKKMTRGVYLQHYAKDDNGKYIGSEEPALDCILNNQEDREKWRRG